LFKGINGYYVFDTGSRLFYGAIHKGLISQGGYALNINDLKVGTPYRVTKSKYQFEVGDTIYLYDANTLVLQADGSELHKCELAGGSTGFAVTGTVAGS